MSTPEPEYICWLDLETTWLHHNSAILEVAVVITDMQLNEKARGAWIVNPDLKPSEYGPGYVRKGNSNWLSQMPVNVLEMHVSSGLVRKVANGKALQAVDEEVARLIEKTCGKTALVALGGSGVSHFDLQVIRAQMPYLASKLVYWTIDVGNVRRFVTRVMGHAFERTEVAHRAMADVDQSIAEAKRLRLALVWGLD